MGNEAWHQDKSHLSKSFRQDLDKRYRHNQSFLADL